MIVVRVNTQLVSVRPIHLPAGGEIVVRIRFEGASLVGVGEIQQLPPTLVGQLLLRGRNRRLDGNRAIAGEDTLMQKVSRLALDRELEVSILKPFRNAFVECGRQMV